MANSAQIIYINGPSSSGKSSLARALQQELDLPFLHISLDKFIGMMPEKLNNWEGGSSPLGFSWKSSLDNTGHPIQQLQMGPYAKKISAAFREIALTLAKLGHHMIIDDVAFGKPDVDRWKETLKGYPVLWVGITAPLELLEERERKRGNRIAGSARAQYSQVHEGVSYDLEFDISKKSLESIARKICQTRIH